jgi:pyrroline-5-carboxylate reductase
MGIAILSGVIASLESSIDRRSLPKWESHTPGTLTPTTESIDMSTPSRFIACVSRQESVKTLNKTFSALPRAVEVVASRNLEAVEQSTVILLWYASCLSV